MAVTRPRLTVLYLAVLACFTAARPSSAPQEPTATATLDELAHQSLATIDGK